MSKNYKKVTAIILCEKLEEVEKAMIVHHIAGVTINEVKGYGEYHDFHCRDMMCKHTRLEVFCDAERAHEVAQCIMIAARTGMKGDGIVAITPADDLYHIRTGNAIDFDGELNGQSSQYF